MAKNMGLTQWIWLAVALLGLVSILYFNRQLKILFFFLRNALLGAAGLYGGNILLGFAGLQGLYVGINALTLLVVGVLGVPGMAMLYITQWMLQ